MSQVNAALVNPNSIYGAHYYRTGCGAPYERNEVWMGFFRGAAERIRRDLNPASVLDAGCALGFLVEGLREQGIDVEGIDLSDYAIGNVHPSIRDCCRVQSVTAPLARRYDLIVCIEVLEHLEAADAEQAVANLCRSCKRVLFSSTPFDYHEATHFNVRPPEYWAELFARHGFYKDVDFDASFLTAWAGLFCLTSQPFARTVAAYERRHWQMRQEVKGIRETAIAQRGQLENLVGQVASQDTALETAQQALKEAREEGGQFADHLAAESARGRQLAAESADWSAQAHRLAARLEELEGSLAWAVGRRLSHLRHRLAPEGSSRSIWFRRALRGLRIWHREGARGLGRHAAAAIRRRLHLSSGGELPRALSSSPDAPPAPAASLPPAETAPAPLPQGPDRTGGANVPTERKFRLVFLGTTDAWDNATMRYRAHNVIEALALVGMEAAFVPEEEALARLPFILSHDLIVLVRRKATAAIAAVAETARRAGLPVVYDIDDYIFELWVLPYVEGFRAWGQSNSLPFMDLVGECLARCDYFTGATRFLAEKAVALGKTSFQIHNGLNAEQIRLSRRALERRCPAAPGEAVRIGYFPGTPTHQGDFRTLYPALMALLHDEAAASLMIVGGLDLGEFPGLAPFADRIERRPFIDWRELPAEIARVDINLIPLELTPFNEGKSNLKYYEAGLVKVPSIASPTQILRESITHGDNGLLAQTTNEWYQGLKELVSDAGLRERMGQKAFEHVRRNYAPEATAVEAVEVYRHIIRTQRARRGVPEHALSIVMLVPLPGGPDESAGVLHLANELTDLGDAVTVLLPAEERWPSAAEARQYLADHLVEPRFAVQLGGEVPCCDVLMATGPDTVDRARTNQQRAHLTVNLAPANEVVRDRPEDLPHVPMIRGGGRDLQCLLRKWVEDRPLPCCPTRPASGDRPLAA